MDLNLQIMLVSGRQSALMRNCKILLGALSALILIAGVANAATDEAFARMDGDLVGHLHFAGIGRVTEGGATNLIALGNLPETAVLRDITLQKLATLPFRLFRANGADGITNMYANLMRPLLDDLLREESYAEMRNPSSPVPELMLAVHLDNARAKVWRDNLATAISGWTGIPVTEIKGNGFTGWELKKHHDPNLIRFLRAGDWVLLGWGRNELRLQPAFLQRLQTKKRPADALKEDWLDVSMDWPAYMRYHPFTLPSPFPAKLPKMHLTVQTKKDSAKKDYIRPKLVMQYAEPLNLNLEPWRIPTEIIHNPIVSFAAARGTAQWFSQLETVKKIQPPSVPNQISFWSMARTPFESCAAIPVAGASNYLAQIQSRFLPAVNGSFTNWRVSIQATWTNNEIMITSFPFLRPDLRAIHEPSGDFLLGTLFPVARMTNAAPFPSALMHELQSKPNLVFYSWEINDERVAQWQSIGQIYLISKGNPPQQQELPGAKWLKAARSRVGNCATEMTLTSPNELTLLRNAPVGFSGLELVALEYWLDSPGFPLEANYPKMMPNAIHGQRPPK